MGYVFQIVRELDDKCGFCHNIFLDNIFNIVKHNLHSSKAYAMQRVHNCTIQCTSSVLLDICTFENIGCGQAEYGCFGSARLQEKGESLDSVLVLRSLCNFDLFHPKLRLSPKFEKTSLISATFLCIIPPLSSEVKSR